jgi:hypothetical protein
MRESPWLPPSNRVASFAIYPLSAPVWPAVLFAPFESCDETIRTA